MSEIAFQSTPCPYAGEALRNDIRVLLNRIEERHAGTKFTVFKSIEKLRPALAGSCRRRENSKNAKNAATPQQASCAWHARLSKTNTVISNSIKSKPKVTLSFSYSINYTYEIAKVSLSETGTKIRD